MNSRVAASARLVERVLNDTLQGSAQSLGFLFGGEPEFLLDTRRGLYSYQAMQSRLAQNTFAVDSRVDLSGPVLRLANLTPEDFFVLLTKAAARLCPRRRGWIARLRTTTPSADPG